MAFTEKYLIHQQYLSSPSARRRGYPMHPGVRFVVAHDTGNPESTAAQNVAYFARTAIPTNSEVSSVHFFVDDDAIIECVPVLNGHPEKAWHVRPLASSTNRLFGLHANDAAVGVEYCYGKQINPDQAYRRYVWLLAYLCYRFGLDPATSVVGHFMLDPHRKTDPVTGLAHSRRSYDQLLHDIVTEFRECSGQQVSEPALISEQAGQVRATVRLHIRRGRPSTLADVCGVAEVGALLDFVGSVSNGTAVNGNRNWYRDPNGNYFWSGGTADVH